MSVLYVKEQGSCIQKRSERIVVTKGQMTLLEIPLANVENIAIIGNVLITVLPDEIKSPKMTAEWEMALNHIAQNTETADEFLNGITELMQELVARYQGISGAGKTFKDWPEMVGNIIPFIGGEEEKSEQEPLRLWGKVENGEIVKATSPVITTQCIRVPVLDGHTAAVFVKFKKKPTKEQLIETLVNFSGEPQKLELPSAPKQFIQYLEEDNRPQVSLDVNFENGMGVSVGRLREDTVYDYKFVGLSHNTLRGAAGGAVLSAELLVAKGYIEAK